MMTLGFCLQALKTGGTPQALPQNSFCTRHKGTASRKHSTPVCMQLHACCLTHVDILKPAAFVHVQSLGWGEPMRARMSPNMLDQALYVGKPSCI